MSHSAFSWDEHARWEAREDVCCSAAVAVAVAVAAVAVLQWLQCCTAASAKPQRMLLCYACETSGAECTGSLFCLTTCAFNSLPPSLLLPPTAARRHQASAAATSRSATST